MAIKCLAVDENDQEKNKYHHSFHRSRSYFTVQKFNFHRWNLYRIDSHFQISFTILFMKSEKKIFPDSSYSTMCRIDR